MCGAYPRAQHRAVELRDSKVLAAAASAGDHGELSIVLSALVHVSTGTPGVDQGTVWAQELELLIRGGALLQAPASGTLWISEGSVELGGVAHALLPFSLDAVLEVRVDLRGAEGALIATGRGISIVPRAEPEFVERFEGGNLRDPPG